MDYLISLYDNALIYYPNVFFAALFFIIVLGIVSISIGIILIGKKIKVILKQIRNNLKQIKRIKIKEKKKISFAPIVRVFFEKKRTSLVCIIGFLIIFFGRAIKVTFIRINTALGYIESQTEKIIKKIGKEVLIDE